MLHQQKLKEVKRKRGQMSQLDLDLRSPEEWLEQLEEEILVETPLWSSNGKIIPTSQLHYPTFSKQ